MADSTPVFKLVLTGGPCGGKTSALKRIEERLPGWDLYTVPEVPSIMLAGGCKYPGNDLEKREALLAFETGLIQLQMQMEDSFLQVARSTGRPSVVVFDRGACDVAAYLPAEIWGELLVANGWTTESLLSRYDCVVHLVTAADGAEAFYTLANNAVRSETPEHARDLDAKILAAWASHPAHRVVDNSSDFNGKMDRAWQAVSSLMP